MKKINIITGHYGSGKTNIAVNMAVELAKQGKKTAIVDLDIVNPYFRSADFEELFSGCGVELVKPLYANTNLDIPAISFDLERIANDDGYVIIDVGGDDDGAVALGRYAGFLSLFGDDLDFFYVVNKFRYLKGEEDEALGLLWKIEAASRLRATKIINNSNLGRETTPQDVLSSIGFAEKIAKESGLPLEFSTAPREIACPLLDGKVKYVDIYVKPVWDE